MRSALVATCVDRPVPVQSYLYGRLRPNIWQSGAVPVIDRIPAFWLVLSGIISVQVGAAIAKDLFDLIPPTAMVWLRLITSAVILLLVARPRWTRAFRS
jgi:hypothetical protein